MGRNHHGTEPSKTDTESFLKFINLLFDGTTGAINLCTLRNGSGGAGPQITNGDAEALKRFVIKHNHQGWGVYTCVSSMRPGINPEDGKSYHHCKEAVFETPSLHVDIDCKDLALDTKDSVIRKLKALCGLNNKSFAPSIIDDSGNGVHAFWRFKEAFTYSDDPEKRQEEINRIEAALKLLCDLVGGDFKVCQPSAVMRLVGTHNTKHEGQNHLVTILEQNDNVFELDDLEQWLSESSPKILRKVRPEAKTAGEQKPEGDNSSSAAFERLARLAEENFKPPINWEKRIDAMMYMGPATARFTKHKFRSVHRCFKAAPRWMTLSSC
jgi:hypothetical protein